MASQIPQCLVRSVIECLLHEPVWTDLGGILCRLLNRLVTIG
jgi:hypothetical protein